MQRLVAFALAVCTLAGIVGQSAVAKDPVSQAKPAAIQADVAKTTNSQGGLVVTKRDSEKVMSFSAGMGGFGGAVHSAG